MWRHQFEYNGGPTVNVSGPSGLCSASYPPGGWGEAQPDGRGSSPEGEGVQQWRPLEEQQQVEKKKMIQMRWKGSSNSEEKFELWTRALAEIYAFVSSNTDVLIHPVHVPVKEQDTMPLEWSLWRPHGRRGSLNLMLSWHWLKFFIICLWDIASEESLSPFKNSRNGDAVPCSLSLLPRVSGDNVSMLGSCSGWALGTSNQCKN